MSVIKSFSVGNGDMFYIRHNTDNFTIIDCCLNDYTEDGIIREIVDESKGKNIRRFISTHPDDDHIRGLEVLDDEISIANFYCVKNTVIKEDETDSFTRYCELRDDTKKAFYITKGCTRKWMNQDGDGRFNSGISILWPDRNNEEFKKALACAEDGESPNNISAIIKYEIRGGATALWMGDLETDFMEFIEDSLNLPLVDILFAPHHGRYSGRIPTSMLDTMMPRMIVIGEAPSEHLHYYDGYNTICQNSAGDIVFECIGAEVHVFTSNYYEADFLENKNRSWPGYYYIGTLPLSSKVSAATA